MEQTLRTAAQMCDRGFAAEEEKPALDQVAERYAVALPPVLAGLIDRDDANDPIARQFVPSEAELERQPEELLDPIGDDAHADLRGLLPLLFPPRNGRAGQGQAVVAAGT